MMPQAEQYPYVSMNPALGPTSLFPFLPITLALRKQSVSVMGLLDTGAAVNVLPYHIGLQLEAAWEEQTTSVQLTGNLASEEARGLVLWAAVGKFSPVQLVFAWTKSNTVPLLLGQMNFFLEFDICFSRTQSSFELKPKK